MQFPAPVPRSRSGSHHSRNGRATLLDDPSEPSAQEGLGILEGIRDGLRDGRGEFDTALGLRPFVVPRLDRLAQLTAKLTGS